MPDLHRQHQAARGDTTSTWGSLRTLGKGGYGLLPRWFRQQISYCCRLLQQVSICLPSSIHTSCQDVDAPERPVFCWRHASCSHDGQQTSFQWQRVQTVCREFDFFHQTSSPHFHQSNRFIKSMVKKVKATFKKADGAPNAQAWALLQLWDTPIVSDLPSPAEILHGCPAQGAVLPRPHRPINTQQICQKLIEIQNAQKEQFDWAHWAKDLRCLQLREQVRFLPNKQHGAPVKWLTGTVSEILEWGCSYMIKGPNGKTYRRNRVHLKLICHDGSSFHDHKVDHKVDCQADHQPTA